MANQKTRLSQHVVERAAPAGEPYFIWDRNLKGFGLRVTPSGAKSYFVKLRVKGSGKVRKPTLGRHPSMLCGEARELAREQIFAASQGRDPHYVDPSLATTVEEFWKIYHQRHVRVKQKASTARETEALARRFLVPEFGDLPVSEITAARVSDLHARLSATPHQANRVRALISNFFNKAQQWGYAPNVLNPCKAVPKYKESARSRYLTAAEVKRLNRVLDEFAPLNPSFSAAIRFLLLTGMRRSEALALRWDWVDFDRGIVTLPDSKTGPKPVILGQAAIDLLMARRKSAQGSVVFPGKNPDAPAQGLQKFWERVRTKAELEDVRIHDLRHTFASAAVASGTSLYVVGKLLGQKSPSTTARYAHLGENPLREAADAASAGLVLPSG